MSTFPNDDDALGSRRQLQELAKRAEREEEWSGAERAQVWEALEARLHIPVRRSSPAPWALAVTALSLALWWTWRAQPARAPAVEVTQRVGPASRQTENTVEAQNTVEAPNTAEAQNTAEALNTVEAPHIVAAPITLKRGRVTLGPRQTRARQVNTPFLSVHLLSGKVAVDAFESHALVHVSEGWVRVERPGCGPKLLGVGAEFDSREPCGLARQNELFRSATSRLARAELEPALREFELYLQELPEGALAPEAALQRIRLLLTLQRTEEARAGAVELRRRHGENSAALRGLRQLERKLRAESPPEATPSKHEHQRE